MVNLTKVSNQILKDGLYNTLLSEIQDRLGTKNITATMIEKLLSEDSYFIKEYKEINTQSEQSSIQVKELIIKDKDASYVRDIKKSINENIQILKNLESFETDSKESAYAIWVGSIGVTVIFMAHNIFGLFSELYTTHPALVFSSYIVMSVFSYYTYIKMKTNHDKQHKVYTQVYTTTKKMIEDSIKNSYLKYDEVYVE